MSNEIHRTVPRMLSDSPEDGWEFVCPHCEYRAHYFVDYERNEFRLVVLTEGQKDIRHIGGLPPQSAPATPMKLLRKPDADQGEPWLPPYLQQQIEEILRRSGFGQTPA